MRQYTADSILLIIVIILGSTFLIVKSVLGEVGPLNFLFFRFLLALFAVLPWSIRRVSEIRPQELKAGVILAFALTAGFACQTIGLQTTAPGKAAFITGLNVVLVPILARVWFHEQIPVRAMLGILCAFTGLALLCLNASLEVETGDIWVLFCALAFAIHVAAVTRYASDCETHSLNFIQIAVTTLISGTLALAYEPFPKSVSSSVMLEILFMGLVATALILFFQIVAQRHTSATRAALIFSLEPVFASLFAWCILGDIMDRQQFSGAGLMLAGVVLTELRVSRDPSSCKV